MLSVASLTIKGDVVLTDVDWQGSSISCNISDVLNVLSSVAGFWRFGNENHHKCIERCVHLRMFGVILERSVFPLVRKGVIWLPIAGWSTVRFVSPCGLGDLQRSWNLYDSATLVVLRAW